jgi:hypothetical protein
MKPLRFLLCLCALHVAFAAHAQWQWVDKDGRKVFSDRAPPPDIEDKNILKRPAVRAAASTPAATAAGQGAPAAAGVDKSLSEKKKQVDAAEAEKRKADDERNARVRADNCARAQQAQAALQAGGRMTRMNEKGEREFMDEAAIAAEAQRLQGLIDENCR